MLAMFTWKYFEIVLYCLYYLQLLRKTLSMSYFLDLTVFFFQGRGLLIHLIKCNCYSLPMFFFFRLPIFFFSPAVPSTTPSHYPRIFCTLPSFACIKRPRWRPVELNDRHLRYRGKIGAMTEQSNLTRHNRYKNVLPLSVFQSLLQKVEDDLGAVKAYGASLTAQRNSLRMVPNLFGVINF